MKKITLFLFALFTCWQINAQVSSYAFSQSSGTYTPITGGTLAASGASLDDTILSVTLPTAFAYNGNSITTVGFSPNGYLIMGNTTTHGYTPLSSTATSNGVISGLGMDLVSNAATSELRWEQIGNEIIFQWKEFRRYLATPESINFQIRLNTSNGQINIVYDAPTTVVASETRIPQVGLRGTANTDYNARRLTTSVPDATPSWNDTAAATSNAHNVRFTNTSPAAFPSSGLTFTWSPPVPCSGAPVAGSVTPALQNICSGTTPANLVATGFSSGVTGLTFQWEESNDDGATDAWAPVVGGTGATTATYTPPAFSGTPIYYRLNVTCTNSTTSAQTASVLVTVPITPTNQITALTIPAATVGAGQAVVNWTNGNGGRRVVYVSDSATFTDPVDGNAPALVANNVYSGSGQQIIFDGTAATVTVTGLMPGTQYYIKAYEYVRCGSGPYDYYYNVTTGTNTGNFTTCPAFTVPYFEGFESGYTHNTVVAGCISQASVTGTAVWTANSTFTDRNRTPRTGAFNAFLQWSNEDWMFIPIDLIGGTSYRVSLYARQDGAAATDSNIAISYGTSSSVAGMTNSIVAATGIINGNYQEIVGDFTPATSGTYYVGIKGYMNGNPFYISLDDISITESPSCLNPNTIIASNITSNSVDLSWTDGSGGLQFDYEYVIQAPGTGEPTGPGAPIGDVAVVGEGFDIDGNPLTPDTLYEVYVRAVCNGGSDFSTWSGPITFRTLCNSITSLPHSESFDAAALPSCWSTALISGSTNWAPTTNNDGVPAPRTGTRFAGKSWLGDDNALLISPPYDLSAYATDQARLNVWIYRSANGLATDRVTFYANTANNLTGATMLVDVPLPITSAPTVASAGWYNYTVDVPLSYNAGGVFYIIAQGRTSSSWSSYSVGFDDYVLELTPTTAPSCASNIVATPHATCGNFANTITWDATAGADGYYVTIGTTTGGNNIANAIPVSGTSYNFTGNFNTTYFYTIVPFNANGSATGCSELSFVTNANGCYCVSAPTSVDGSGITNVQIVSTDFPNTVSTSPVYNDHTTTPVTMSQGVNNNVQISFNVPSFGASYDYNTVIWIDANDDYVLDASEIVYTGLSSTAVAPTLLNASFVMPATMPLGQHRMRIVATDALQTPANPCYSGTFGETADFTVNIVAASCTPPAATTTLVPACGASQYSIDVDVTALGSGTPSITDGTTTWPVSAIGVVNVGPFASGSSVTLTLLHGSDATCNLPLGSFNYACPPANDDCVNAIALTPGGVFADYPVVGTTVNATTVTGLTYACQTNRANDVWYSVVVPASGTITIETQANGGSALTDTVLSVFSGTCGALVEVGCDDDNGVGAFSIVNLTQPAGTTLYIGVWRWSSATNGTFQVSAYDASLSSGSFDNANFVAYPNPVKDFLNVSYSSEISSVRVINMIGQEVISKNLNATSGQVDMSQLSAGTYIVNVTVGDAVKTLKVVKQ
ncbi:T9SS type A sorting domain-containing protein [Flavobacterium channae]|uniref:T9SS type A sorting domain-containing protein n=1 Tax=Flavobacterium channae TaxID=2897181 RepID=UPI001E5EC099|nr:T9SS type A sorting domain-containing protein [Flavobacterium channae]UGS24590.1 T9SS type A sorting domain-containing protein [Flavobacterium channae]